MEKNNILSASLLDLVFDGRNKAYGAYELRKTYNKRIGKAMMITGALGLMIFMGTVLANTFKKESSSERVAIKEMTIENIEVEKDEPEPLPPPEKKPEPVAVATEKFTIPDVAPDEDVKEPPPAQDDLANTKIDLTKNAGIDDVGIVVPPQDLDGGKGLIEVKKQSESDVPFTKVEKEAEFEGGANAWKRFLERNLNADVPPGNGAPAGRYTVVIQFVVDKEGKVSNIVPITAHGYGMEEEAIRVLKKAKQWIPAIQNGNAVKAYRKQPITFDVQDGN